MGHQKLDRMLALARRVAAAGRALRRRRRRAARTTPTCRRSPGSTRRASSRFAALSGLVPRVGIASGRCFAGQRGAARLLRRHHRDRGQQHRHGRPRDDRGRRPRHVHARGGRARSTCRRKNGVVDVRVRDEAEAVRRREAVPRATSRGRLRGVDRAPIRRTLRDALPEQPPARVRDPADPRDARRHRARCSSCGATSARSIVTALARIEGRAGRRHREQPYHLGGAIDADAADKAARFLQLCDAFGLPDRVALRHAGLHGRPGGGDDGARAPRVADVRRRGEPLACRSSPSCCARATASARRRWPAGTSTRRSSPSSWPTGEFGGMGLEGAVRLGDCGRSSRPSTTRPRASETFQGAGRDRLRARQGDQHGVAPRDRRRDRPGRHARVDRARPERRRRGAVAAPQAPRRRPLVTRPERRAITRPRTAGRAPSCSPPSSRRRRRTPARSRAAPFTR